MALQSFNLFLHLSILENRMLGPARVRKIGMAETRETVMMDFERVKIPEQVDKFPGQMSGVEQQRMAIARLLCMNPKIMLLSGFDHAAY